MASVSVNEGDNALGKPPLDHPLSKLPPTLIDNKQPYEPWTRNSSPLWYPCKCELDNYNSALSGVLSSHGTNTAESSQRSRTIHPSLQIRQLAPSSSRPDNSSNICPQYIRLRRAPPNSQHPIPPDSLRRICPLHHPPRDIRLGHLVRLPR